LTPTRHARAGREVEEDVVALAGGEELIASGAVDAVVVTSWGPTHEQYVPATQEACRRIVAAEVAAGRRLVQVGFDRRYDPAHRALEQAVDGGADVGLPNPFRTVHVDVALLPGSQSPPADLQPSGVPS
jgi:myo-inositol 2-dehydrogenase / D-chiro-inositol 1-dehydrogenase